MRGYHLVATAASPKVLVFELGDVALNQRVEHVVDQVRALFAKSKGRFLKFGKSRNWLWLVFNRANLVQFWRDIIH